MTNIMSIVGKRLRIIVYTAFILTGMMYGPAVFASYDNIGHVIQVSPRDLGGNVYCIPNESMYDDGIQGSEYNMYAVDAGDSPSDIQYLDFAYSIDYHLSGGSSVWGGGGQAGYNFACNQAPSDPPGAYLRVNFNNFTVPENRSYVFLTVYHATEDTAYYAVFYIDRNEDNTVRSFVPEYFNDPNNPALTRITTVQPYNQYVSSTTPVHVGFTGYLSSLDFVDKARVKMTVFNYAGKARDIVIGANFINNIVNSMSGEEGHKETIYFEDLQPGDISGDKTTADKLPLGQYFITTEIQVPSTNFFNFFDVSWNTVYSTTTSFAVDSLTVADQRREYNMEKYIEGHASSTASMCNVISFHWYGCVKDIFDVLFVPSDDNLEPYVTEWETRIYNHAPLGYIKRIQDILTDTTNTSLPLIDYTFSTSSRSALSPILGGQRIHLDPFQYATGTNITSITSDGANGLPEKNLWEIVQPFYTLVLGLVLAFMIFHDLTNIHAHGQDVNLTKNKV